MRSPALPGDPLTPKCEVGFVIDTLVDAILDAPDPARLTTGSRPHFAGGELCTPVVLVRLNHAQWELSIPTWARACGELAMRSRHRLNHPGLGAAMQTLLDAGMPALRQAIAFDIRGTH